MEVYHEVGYGNFEDGLPEVVFMAIFFPFNKVLETSLVPAVLLLSCEDFKDYPRWMLRKNSIEFPIGLDLLLIQIVHGLCTYLL